MPLWQLLICIYCLLWTITLNSTFDKLNQGFQKKKFTVSCSSTCYDPESEKAKTFQILPAKTFWITFQILTAKTFWITFQILTAKTFWIKRVNRDIGDFGKNECKTKSFQNTVANCLNIVFLTEIAR